MPISAIEKKTAILCLLVLCSGCSSSPRDVTVTPQELQLEIEAPAEVTCSGTLRLKYQLTNNSQSSICVAAPTRLRVNDRTTARFVSGSQACRAPLIRIKPGAIGAWIDDWPLECFSDPDDPLTKTAPHMKCGDTKEISSTASVFRLRGKKFVMGAIRVSSAPIKIKTACP